jgi:malate synthase
VNFDKITTQLPGFKARWIASDGAAELHELFKRIDLQPETFAFRAFTRLKQLKYLQRTNQIDDDLFWTARPGPRH